MNITYQAVYPRLFDERRPYCQARIQALDGERRVGYLNFEWISSQHFDQTLPTIWHYASEFTGWCLGIEPNDDVRDPKITARVLKSACRYSYEHLNLDVDTLTYDQQQRLLDKLSLSIKPRFEKFKESIDWVYVGYSRVDNGERWPEGDTKSYRRQGIGTRLYHLAAMWLAVHRNTALHSSTLISDEAKGLWDKLEATGAPTYWVDRPETDKQVRALDYAQCSVLLAQAHREIDALPHVSPFEEKNYCWP